MSDQGNCCVYPIYLSSNIYFLNSKKIIIGVDHTFEIKCLFANCSRLGFIELTKESLLKFIISLKQIQNDIKNLKRNVYDFGDNVLLKINIKNSQAKIRLIDTRREVNLYLSHGEITKFQSHEKVLLYTIQKLLLNLSSFLMIYADYLKIVNERQIFDLSIGDATYFLSKENYSVDLLKIFLEIFPVIGLEKIKRDVELQKMTKKLFEENL